LHVVGTLHYIYNFNYLRFEELLLICKNAFETLLDEFESKQIPEKTIKYLNQINLEIFSDLANSNLETNIKLLFLTTQKKTLLNFIPAYISDITVCLNIVQTIEDKYLFIQKGADLTLCFFVMNFRENQFSHMNLHNL